MENDKLKKAYEAVEMLKALDLPVSKEQLNAISELERECIIKEIIPRLEKVLKPLVENLRTSFLLEIRYSSGKGLEINNKDDKQSNKPKLETNKHQGRRNKPTSLKVTFPDGHTIYNEKAAKTLLAVVDYIGFERVEQLRLNVSGQPFVSKERYPRDQQKKGEWYVTSHSGTIVKKQQIEKLSELFHLNLIVELV